MEACFIYVGSKNKLLYFLVFNKYQINLNDLNYKYLPQSIFVSIFTQSKLFMFWGSEARNVKSGCLDLLEEDGEDLLGQRGQKQKLFMLA